MSRNETVKKKARKNVVVGIACIKATFNNTIVTITDMRGNKIASASAGELGYAGAKKSTPHVAQLIVDKAGTVAKEHGLKTISIKVKGPGNGKEAAIKALERHFLITMIEDRTAVAHNGCRPPKRRRV